jgi:hypothetical protein
MNILLFILTLIGVIVAILALGYQRNQAESARRQEAAAREATRRREVGVAEWMRALRDWASEAIDVLSEAVYASDGIQGHVPSDDARRYIPRLSALIDRGRLFFPNQYKEKYGTNKPPAFRGLRHAALDPLVSALIVLEGNAEVLKEVHDYVADNRRDVLRELQMEFVSHIQQILDPGGHNQKIAWIIKDSEEQTDTILGRKNLGHTTLGLVRHVVKRLREEEGSGQGIKRQEEAPQEST